MRCITYAIGQYIKHGGYISVRKCYVFKGVKYLEKIWLPHLLQCDEVRGVRQMAGKYPPEAPWREFLYMLSGTKYEFRDHDRPYSCKLDEKNTPEEV